MFANDADVATLLVPVRFPTNDPLKDPVLICAEDDTTPLGKTVGANEAEIALDADCAQLAVPINMPVNDPLNDPVLIWVDEDTNPDGLPEMEFQSLAAPDT